MNKDINKNKSSSSSSMSKTKNTLDIEKAIDRIIVNKDKNSFSNTKKNHEKSDQIKRYFPVNKNSVYFIRERKKINNNDAEKVDNNKLKKKSFDTGVRSIKIGEKFAVSKIKNRLNKSDVKNEINVMPKKTRQEKSQLHSDETLKTVNKKDSEELFDQIKTADGVHQDIEKDRNKDTAAISQQQHYNDVSKQSKYFASSHGSAKINRMKGLFSKKSKVKSTEEQPETDIDKNKNILNEYQKRKTVEHLDEFVQNLTSEEAEWLDQKIMTSGAIQAGDEKVGYNGTIPFSQSQHEKKVLKKDKYLGKKLKKKRTVDSADQKELKTFFSKKQSKKSFKNPFQKNIKSVTKKSISSKKDIDDKKSVMTTQDKRALMGNKFRRSFKKIKNIRGRKLTTTKLEFENKKTSIDSKAQTIDNITPDGKIHSEKEAEELKTDTIKKLGYAEGSWEELDFYPLQEPFAYVEIIREKDTLDKRYILVEVGLSENEVQLIDFIKETLTGFSVDTTELEKNGEKKYLIEKIEQILEDYMIQIDDQLKNKIIYFFEKEFLGLYKLEILMRDPNIEDISCDGSNIPIFLYHRKYGSLKGSIKFDDEDELSAFVIKLAQKCGKHISIAEPMLDATMPDGSRIQMTLSTEVTTKGSTFTIRKFKEDPFSPPDLIEFNTMSSEMIAYMWMAVENGINALVAGGTAAGKTSTLNALSLFIPRESKIVSIEETREINLPHPNWIPGVSRSGFGEVVGNKVIGEIDLYDLMKAALRQRPEYIIVGEIRGREAYVLFQAMSTGHTTYSTVHADSAQSLIHRLEGKPINIPRIMLQALDIVCIQVITRIRNKRARRVKQIIEIIDIDPSTKEILTNEVFRWDPVEDKFIYSGKSYILERVRAEKDLSREEITNEIKNRAKLLEWMNKNNVREFKKAATLISQYIDNSNSIMDRIKVKS